MANEAQSQSEALSAKPDEQQSKHPSSTFGGKAKECSTKVI